jgi:integral membrane protein (TIGR01906 family)
MKTILKIAYWLTICSLPLLFISSNIRFGANEIKLYEYGIKAYKISQVTGIDDLELKRIHQHLIDYYNYREDSPQVNVKIGGRDLKVFNDKELIHLKDVRGLIQLDYLVQTVIMILLVVSGALLCWKGEERWSKLIKALLRGSLLTCIVVIVSGILSLFFFDQLFVLFHLLSFSNEFWILDPSRDYLIMLFPGQFFYDVALFGFGAIVMESLILAGITHAILTVKGRFKNKTLLNRA